jgi:phosphodiesterase/alkaline phosphatase D-like protein
MSTPYLIASANGTLTVNAVSVPVVTGTTAGDSISLAVGGSASVVSSVTDSKGNQYVQGPNTTTGQKCSIWVASGSTVALVGGGTPDSFTVTYASVTGTYDVIAAGYTGGIGGLDATSEASAAGTSTAPSVTSGVLAASGEIVYAVFQNGNTGGAPTLGGGWTQIGTSQHVSSSTWLTLAYQVAASTSAVSASATISVSTTWTVLVAGLISSAMPGAVIQHVAGAPTSAAFTVVSKISGGTSLRLKVATDQALTQNVTFVAAQAPDGFGYTRHTPSGLSAGTQYYYRLADTPAGGSEALTGPTGMCKTLKPAGSPQSFTVSLVSCVTQAAADTAAMNDWTAYNADLKIFTGDFDYSNTTATDEPTQVAVYETQIASSGPGDPVASAAGYSSSYGMLTSRAWGFYCRSDHEAGPDNGDSDNAYTATNIAAAQQVFPFGPLGDQTNNPVHGLYQTWVVGRVRFIMLDIRNTDRSPGANTDNSSKTMLGALQLAWLKTQLTQPEPLKVIISDVQWMGNPTTYLYTNGPDKWFSYSTERAAIVSFIQANQATVQNVMLWHGDAHCLGCTPASGNSWGGFPVYCAAPMHNVGGGLDLGTFTQEYNNGGGNCRQYGRITLTDNGSTITSVFNGWDAETQTLRVSQTDVFSTVTPANQGQGMALNAGLQNVVMPNGSRYAGGAQVILSSDEYSQLSPTARAALMIDSSSGRTGTYTVTVAAGLKGVVLPDGLMHKGGDVVILSDAQYSTITPNAISTIFSSVTLAVS